MIKLPPAKLSAGASPWEGGVCDLEVGLGKMGAYVGLVAQVARVAGAPAPILESYVPLGACCFFGGGWWVCGWRGRSGLPGAGPGVVGSRVGVIRW
jgi:hypothetical protein